MKKQVLWIAMGVICPIQLFAGGIVTNSNQSASYVRMLARDASTTLDAVYYNPAGITQLEDGFHFSLNNQSIFQRKTIENKFPLLHESKYVGDVAAPFYPDVYAVYKKGKFAFGFGFQPNSGGGSAQYQTGLPSFEIPISVIPASLTASGIPTNNYSADINFDGSSVFWGTQLNASYALTDMISVSGGVRMILAKNTYDGYLKNIMINPNQQAFGASYNGSNLVSATTFFGDAAKTLSTWATGASSYSEGLKAVMSNGGGTVLITNGTSAGLSAEQVTQIQGLVTAAGQNPAGMDIQTAQAVLTAAAPVFTAKAAKMTANAEGTKDKTVESEQTGTGYTPFFGADVKVNDKINIGIKYEFRTKLTLKNDTKIDGTGMFKDGDQVRSDIPAILSVGVDYKLFPQLKFSTGVHYYFDKDAVIESAPGVKKTIDGNLYEVALGMEYDITEKVLISAGYLFNETGVGQGYQTDLTHSLTSNTVGFGGGFKVNEKMMLNLGVLYTMYSSDAKSIDYKSYGVASATETYNRTNLVFSIGVDYHL